MRNSNVILISRKELKKLVMEAIESNKQDGRISRRAKEFFSSKHGRNILEILNGKRFDRDKIEEYLDALDDNDIKWARMMNIIANDVGLNHNAYANYHELNRAMLNRIEKLHAEFVSNMK